MTPDELRKRTKDFALRIIKMMESLPKGMAAHVIGKQLLRSGTSVGQIIGPHVEHDLQRISSAK